jgi:hypothetical protein
MATIEYSSVVNAGRGWTTVTTPDGQTLTIQGDRNTRNNNPGNLEHNGPGSFADRHGAIGSDGRFAVFPSHQAGLEAMASRVFGGYYADLTLAQAIKEYAPPHENNTKAYTAEVARRAGVSPNTKMRDVPLEKRSTVTAAMTRVEGNRPAKVYDAKTGKHIATIDPRHTATPKTVAAPQTRANAVNQMETKTAANSMQTAGLLGLDGRSNISGFSAPVGQVARGGSLPPVAGLGAPQYNHGNFASRTATGLPAKADARVAQAFAPAPPSLATPAVFSAEKPQYSHANFTSRAGPTVKYDHANFTSRTAAPQTMPAVFSPAPQASPTTQTAAYGQMADTMAQAGLMGLDGRSGLFHGSTPSELAKSEAFLNTPNPVAQATPANVPTPTAAPRGLAGNVPTPTPAPRGLAMPTPSPAPRGLASMASPAPRDEALLEQGDGLGYREAPPPAPPTDYLGQGSKALDAVFSGAPAGSFARSTGPNVASFENLGNGMVAKTDAWGNVSYSPASAGLAGAGASGRLGLGSPTISAPDSKDSRDEDRNTGWGLGSFFDGFNFGNATTGARGLGSQMGARAQGAALGFALAGLPGAAVGAIAGPAISRGFADWGGRGGYAGVDFFPAPPPVAGTGGLVGGMLGGPIGGMFGLGSSTHSNVSPGGMADISPGATAAIGAGRAGLY